MSDEKSTQEQEDPGITPARAARRRRRRRRAGRAESASSGEVLDVYGTVTGSGSAVSAERIKRSVFDALS